MRISPIFTQANRSTAMGQAFQRTNCNRPHETSLNNSKDVFIRLAEASLQRPEIESELKSMGLI